MSLIWLLALCTPVPWLLLAGLVSLYRRGRSKHAGPRRHGIVRGAALDIGAAFMFFSVAYRPSHAFLVKAQIRQVEDVDEDDQGGLDSPLRRLHRQLRKIRRGEPVDRLIWRLE